MRSKDKKPTSSYTSKAATGSSSKNKIATRVKNLFNTAAAKGKKRFESDYSQAKAQESNSSKPQNVKQGPVETKAKKESVYSEGYRRAGVNATPSKDVETRKSSGMYNGSVPVAGATSKKLYRKNSPIKGIRNSSATRSVKRAMIKKMRNNKG